MRLDSLRLQTGNSPPPSTNMGRGSSSYASSYSSEDYSVLVTMALFKRHLVDSRQGGFAVKSRLGNVLPNRDKGDSATEQFSRGIVSPEFGKYLSNLGPEVDATAPQVVSATNQFLESLYQKAQYLYQIPNPQAWMSEHGYLSLVWEQGVYQFSVQIYPGGQMDWFWRDTSTGEILADEDVWCFPAPIKFVEKFMATFDRYDTR